MYNLQIIAHRGNFLPEGPIPEVQDKYQIPENTLEAFERAFQNGWGIETDIRITGDGNFVVIHDNDVVRFSKKQGIIDQISLTQIQAFSPERNPSIKIPTLEELCQLAQKYIQNGQTPFISFQIKRGSDPKSGIKVGKAVAEKIGQYGLKNSIVFDATFEEAKILHKKFPWLNLSVSLGEANYAPTIYTPSQVFTPEFTSIYTSVWADEWKIPGSIYNEGMFKKIRQLYLGRIDVISPELHYNENHPFSKDISKLKNLWEKIISWNIDGICTDYPSSLRSL